MSVFVSRPLMFPSCWLVQRCSSRYLLYVNYLPLPDCHFSFRLQDNGTIQGFQMETKAFRGNCRLERMNPASWPGMLNNLQCCHTWYPFLKQEKASCGPLCCWTIHWSLLDYYFPPRSLLGWGKSWVQSGRPQVPRFLLKGWLDRNQFLN